MHCSALCNTSRSDMWAALLGAPNNEWTLQQSYFLLHRKCCCNEPGKKTGRKSKRFYFFCSKKKTQTNTECYKICMRIGCCNNAKQKLCIVIEKEKMQWIDCGPSCHCCCVFLMDYGRDKIRNWRIVEESVAERHKNAGNHTRNASECPKFVATTTMHERQLKKWDQRNSISASNCCQRTTKANFSRVLRARGTSTHTHTHAWFFYNNNSYLPAQEVANCFVETKKNLRNHHIHSIFTGTARAHCIHKSMLHIYTCVLHTPFLLLLQLFSSFAFLSKCVRLCSGYNCL